MLDAETKGQDQSGPKWNNLTYLATSRITSRINGLNVPDYAPESE